MQEFASSILRAMGHAGVTMDNGLIGWATETVRDLFDWEPQDLIGQGLQLLYGSEGDYRRTLDNLKGSFPHGGFSQFECLCRKRDGATFLCSVSTLRFNGHTSQSWDNLIIYKDMTWESDVEHVLRDSWERFIHLADSLSQAVLEIDQIGRVVFVNPAGLAVLGCTQEDLRQGLNLFDLLTAEDRERAAVDLAQELTSDTGSLFEYSLVTKTGERILVKACPRGTFSPKEPTQLRTLVFDVSERTRYERTLRDMEMKLEERRKAQEETSNALEALVREWESHKKAYTLSVSSTIKATLLPLVEELKKSRMSSEAGAYLDVLESKLQTLASPLFDSLSIRYPSLSAKELQVADLIRDGKTTKEIARLFRLTPPAVDFHRNSIRRKLGLTNSKANLRAFLLSFNVK